MNGWTSSAVPPVNSCWNCEVEEGQKKPNKHDQYCQYNEQYVIIENCKLIWFNYWVVQCTSWYKYLHCKAVSQNKHDIHGAAKAAHHFFRKLKHSILFAMFSVTLYFFTHIFDVRQYIIFIKLDIPSIYINRKHIKYSHGLILDNKILYL